MYIIVYNYFFQTIAFNCKHLESFLKLFAYSA